MKLLSTPKQLISIFFIVILTACSSTNTNTRLDGKGTQTGTVLAVKSTYIKPETLRPRIGIAIGSGGYSGVYGGFDVGNVYRSVRDASRPSYRQVITVKQSNGETVAITQISKELFKQGDPVKLILVNGEARVIQMNTPLAKSR